MKAIDTSLRILASATLTGVMFALPLGLALSWQLDLPTPELEVGVGAVPMVALAALPMALTAEDADLGADGADEVSGAGPMLPKVEGTPRASNTVRTSVAANRRVGAATQKVSAAAKKKKKRARPCAPGNPGIQRAEGDTFNIDRSIVDAYAKKPATLGGLGWVARHDGASGKADGFKVGGIRCGNDLHAAGFRNGDVVHSVNGKSITSVPQALWAYATLRKKDLLEVRITRRGNARTLVFDMR